MWVGRGAPPPARKSLPSFLPSFFSSSISLRLPSLAPAGRGTLAVAWPPINSLSSPNNPHRRWEDDALNGVKLRLADWLQAERGRGGRNGKNKVSNLTRLSFAGDRNEVMCPRRPSAAGREGQEGMPLSSPLLPASPLLTNQSVLWP